MNQEKLSRKFKSFKKDYSPKDVEKVFEKKSKILGIMKNQTLQKYIDDVTLYFQMLKDFFSGQYKNIPIGSIAAIIGTLLYILNPIDIVPDVIPGGFVDDLGILIACLNFTKFDIEEYKKAKAEVQQNYLIKQSAEVKPNVKNSLNKEKKVSFKTRLKKFLPWIITANPTGFIVNKVLETVIPLVFNKTIEELCSFIKERLDVFYKTTVYNSLITLLVNVLGILLVIFDPFGEKTSYIIATIFFVLAFSFTLYRFIAFMMNKQYREITFQLIKNIWKTKSISKGVKVVVLDSIPKLANLYKGIDVMSNALPALEQIPDIQDIIKYIISIFWKKLALFLGLLSIYLILFYGIVKPFILVKYF